MRLTIELTPQQDATLSAAARRKGIDRSDLARAIVADHLAELEAPGNTAPVPDAENLAAIALLRSWLEEDATDDPEEIRKAEQELEEFRHNMNANRAAAGERLVYP